jgi:DNA-binding beta-propeller fold protein YncE
MKALAKGSALILASVALLTCAQPSPRPFLAEVQVESQRPRWPRPPSNARVIYLGQFSGEEEFGSRRSWLDRISGWVTGRTQQGFVRPVALSVGGTRLAVADPGLRAVHLIDLSTRRWKTIHRSPDGSLVSPVGVLLLPDGRLLISDSVRNGLWLYTQNGEPEGPFTSEPLERPTGLALDARRGWVWATETLAHRVRAFDLSGREVARVGNRGTELGQFNYPIRVAPDRNGGVWVTDSLNFRVQHVDDRGRVDRSFGIDGDRAGMFARPRGLAVDAEGRVFVVDALFDAVQIFDDRGRLLLLFGSRGAGSGEFWLPSDVALDALDRIYVADAYNRRVQVFAYRPPDAR